MEKLWLHSLASGYISKALSQELGMGEYEKYYFLGLVHDIGKVLLLKAFADTNEKMESDINEIMLAVKNAHTSFGGIILRKWGYSETLVRIPLLHEGPDFRHDTDKEILVVNLASNISDSIGYGLKDDVCADPSIIVSAKLLDIDSDVIDKISNEVKSTMDEVSGIF
jgi:HD-like signal output (HDOD) protein